MSSVACSCPSGRCVVDHDENDNRIRTREVCPTCGREFYGCLSKRFCVGPEYCGWCARGEKHNGAWGPVGVQQYWEKTERTSLGTARCAA